MTNWEPGSVAEFEKNDKFYAAKRCKNRQISDEISSRTKKLLLKLLKQVETDFAIINSDLVDKYKKMNHSKIFLKDSYSTFNQT